MKLLLAILCVVVYCCAATPKHRKCLADSPNPDNSVDGCWPPLVSYTYNRGKNQCEEFLDCFYTGDNIFPTYTDCKNTCMGQ